MQLNIGSFLMATLTVVAPNAPDLLAEEDTGPSNSDNLTADQTPTFSITGLEATATNVQLLRDGVVVKTGTFDGTSGEALLLTDDSLPAGGGTFTYTTRVGDDGPTSPGLDVTIDTTALTVSNIADITPNPRRTSVPSIDVTFSQPIDSTTFDASDVTLLRGATLIPLGGEFTVTLLSGNTYRFSSPSLNAATAPAGHYTIRVNAAGVESQTGVAGQSVTSEEFDVDLFGPAITKLDAITPDPRRDSVDSVTVQFSEPIDLSSVDTGDLTLTRNGQVIPLNSIVLGQNADGSYRIGGLTSANASEGAYELTIRAAGINDRAGNGGNGQASATWVIDRTAPVLTNLLGNRVVQAAAGSPGAVVTFGGLSAIDGVDSLVSVVTTPRSGSTFPLGTTTVTATATDRAGNKATSTFTVTVEPQVADTVGPKILGIRLNRNPRVVTQVVLSFSEDLNPTYAQHVRNYRLRLPGRDRRFGTRDDAFIVPGSATYNPDNRTVILANTQAINRRVPFRLVVNGTTPEAVRDLADNLLDGDSDGRAGGDSFASLSGLRGRFKKVNLSARSTR